jgi:hypothetical protein
MDSIDPMISIDYSLKLFEVPGDSLPETLRERQQPETVHFSILPSFIENTANPLPPFLAPKTVL